LWRNWQTEAHLVLRLKPRNRHGDFYAQITKSNLPVLMSKLGNPPPPWFWDSTKKPTTSFEVKPGETVAISFQAKLEKIVATGFKAKPAKTVAAGFEAKPTETIAVGFEVKPVKTVRVILRPNHSQTVTIGFEAQTDEKVSTLVLRLNQETRAPRLHVHGADRTWRHPTSQSFGHRVPDLCDHPRSSASGLILLPLSSSLHVMLHLPPAHHKTSKHDSPNETKIKEKQNETIPDSNSNLAKSMTHHNQTKELTTWFLNSQKRIWSSWIVIQVCKF
jgi:hypothetical protein